MKRFLQVGLCLWALAGVSILCSCPISSKVTPSATPAPVASIIVFSSYDRAGQQESSIWTIDPVKSAQIQRLTNGNEEDSFPRWSADHSRIAFRRFRRSDNLMSLWVMNADGGQAQQITEWWSRGGGDLHPAFWSPDGQKIYYVKDPGGSCTFLWVYADGGRQTENSVIGAENACQIDISPDGGSIVFRYYGSGVDILVGDLSANGTTVTHIRTILPENQGEYTCPSWSPDGTQIAFANGASLYMMASDGSNLHYIATFNGAIGCLSWSPDSSAIVVSTNGDLYIVSLPSGNEINLTSDSFIDGSPDW